MKLKAGLSIIALTLALISTGCDNKAKEASAATDVLTSPFDKVTKISGKTFGTFYYVTVPGGYPGGEEALRGDAELVFKHVSDAISTFDPTSEVSRFNASKSTGEFVISNYLASMAEEVFRQARRISCAMDPTVQPLVNLWGFGPKGEVLKSPAPEKIDEVREYVGLDKVSLRYAGSGDTHTSFFVKSDPRVELDFSTVGEGMAADELASILDEKGIQNYMIAVAGAIRSKGANPEGKLWGVGIEDPMQQQGVFARVCPQGMAISTAGSYRNFFIDEETGKFYSHIIDPNTGYPVNNRTVSVTVIDRSALVTDALDTGLLVLGADAAVKWGEENNTAVYAIKVDDNKKAHAVYSKAFEPYLKCEVKPGLTPEATAVAVEK